MQKYPRGSRGSPAKGVVWENRSTSSNLVFCAKKRQVLRLSFFGTEDEPLGFVDYHEFARGAETGKAYFFRWFIEHRRFARSAKSRLLVFVVGRPFLAQKTNRSALWIITTNVPLDPDWMSCKRFLWGRRGKEKSEEGRGKSEKVIGKEAPCTR